MTNYDTKSPPERERYTAPKTFATSPTITNTEVKVLWRVSRVLMVYRVRFSMKSENELPIEWKRTIGLLIRLKTWSRIIELILRLQPYLMIMGIRSRKQCGLKVTNTVWGFMLGDLLSAPYPSRLFVQ